MLDVVKIVNGKAVTTSRKVAEVFEKKHCDVLRTIRELEIPADFGQRNFASAEYEAINNLGKKVKYPEYLITRDGFTILAMGFTGKKAMEFKVAYINAFNAMEEALKNQQGCYCCQSDRTVANTPANVIESTIAVIDQINHQILSGKDVDKEVLRYAWNIGKLIQQPLHKAVRAAMPDEFESWIWAYEPGEYPRSEVYADYCQSCDHPMAARWFWPRFRKVRCCLDVRRANGRYVVIR